MAGQRLDKMCGRFVKRGYPHKLIAHVELGQIKWIEMISVNLKDRLVRADIKSSKYSLQTTLKTM